MTTRDDYLLALESACVPLQSNQQIADLFDAGPYYSALMHPARAEGPGPQERIIDTLKIMCPEPSKNSPPLNLAFNTSSILPDSPDIPPPAFPHPKTGK
jgi:hypothetical protein